MKESARAMLSFESESRGATAMNRHTTAIPRAIHSRALRQLALAAAAFALMPLGASSLRGQEKTTPLSKVERLNRAPVNNEVLRVCFRGPWSQSCQTG